MYFDLIIPDSVGYLKKNSTSKNRNQQVRFLKNEQLAIKLQLIQPYIGLMTLGSQPDSTNKWPWKQRNGCKSADTGLQFGVVDQSELLQHTDWDLTKNETCLCLKHQQKVFRTYLDCIKFMKKNNWMLYTWLTFGATSRWPQQASYCRKHNDG